MFFELWAKQSNPRLMQQAQLHFVISSNVGRMLPKIFVLFKTHWSIFMYVLENNKIRCEKRISMIFSLIQTIFFFFITLIQTILEVQELEENPLSDPNFSVLEFQDLIQQQQQNIFPSKRVGCPIRQNTNTNQNWSDLEHTVSTENC